MGIPKSQVKFLLVDDDPTPRRLLTLTVLQVLGYSQIKEAADGPQALELAPTYQPHLVFMDTKMPPGPEGYEVCRQMRQTDYGKRAAIIGMSSNNDPELREQWLDAGADDFMDKDSIMNRVTLDAKIQEMLAKYQQ